MSVTGITLVALGTSMPDTFASMTAAAHDDSADAAIGNVTGTSYLLQHSPLNLVFDLAVELFVTRGIQMHLQSQN